MIFNDFFHFFDATERRLVFRSVVIGVVVWLVVWVLKTIVHQLGEAYIPWLESQTFPVMALVALTVMALAGMFVAGLAHFFGQRVHYRNDEGEVHELLDVEGDGLERAIALYYASEPRFETAILGNEGVDVRWNLSTFWMAIRKFLATLATLGSGGSGGLEASVTLIGESLAAGMFKPRYRVRRPWPRLFDWWYSNDPDDLQTAQLCGIAAAISTLLDAPFTGAFFAVEVMYRRRPLIDRLIYALVAALVAFFLDYFLVGTEDALFGVEQIVLPPTTNFNYYFILVLVCIAIALTSFQFARLRTLIDRFFHQRFGNIWVRHVSGMLITGVIALLVWLIVQGEAQIPLLVVDDSIAEHGLHLIMGTGEAPIQSALVGELALSVAVIALVGKMVATLTTISSGGSAGLLIPSIYFGTMIATIFVQLPRMLGLEAWSFPAMTLVVPAMTASLVSIVNVPLAAIMFAVEGFSGNYLVPAMLALVISTLLAQRNSIYRTQREQVEKRQILPGYGVRRISVPPSWEGQTLIQLNLRQQYAVNVIGWVEQADNAGLPRVRLDADANLPLSVSDILVVLGRDEDLNRFTAVVTADWEASKTTDDHLP